ncbi:Transcription factor 25 [Gonapodya sp. JEL0774]|nr:Transcription factor 25 [Gonapodya sp. JEL0774]
MSRQVRKILKEKERARISAEGPTEHESEEDEAVKPKANLFTLLNVGGEEGSSNSEELTMKQADDTNVDETREDRESPALTSSQSKSTTSNKSRKKKKKGKVRTSGNAPEPASVREAQGGEEEEDEIDRAVRELNAKLGPMVVKSPPPTSSAARPSVFLKYRSLLSASPKYLDPEADLRRLLGQNFDDGAHRRRGARPAPAGVRGAPTRMKKTVLVKLNQEWPRLERLGLEMELVTTVGEVNVFGYSHGSKYMEIEKAFISAVYSFDPNPLANIVRRHPYHVSTLLQLSEVYRHSGDAQTAVDLLERAIFSLEYAFHPRFAPFTLSSANAGSATSTTTSSHPTLPYSNPLNRIFYIALCKHAQALSRGSRHRTALEVAKLMLSTSIVAGPVGGTIPIDASTAVWGDDGWDPLGFWNFLDALALRAGEGKWFVDLCAALDETAEAWSKALEQHEDQNWTEVEKSVARTAVMLRLLPNMVIGRAAATFRFEEEESKGHGESTKLLVDALKEYPMVIPLLYDKLEIHDEEPSVAIIREEIASIDAKNPTSVAGRTLRYCKAYATLSHSIWSAPAQLSFLRSATSQLFAANPHLRASATAPRPMHTKEPSSFHRFLFLTDDATLQALIPEQLLARGMLLHDPLPPARIRSPYDEFLELNGLGIAPPGGWDRTEAEEADGDNTGIAESPQNQPEFGVAADVPAGASERSPAGVLNSVQNLMRWFRGGGTAEALRSLNLWRNEGDPGNEDDEAETESDNFESFDEDE